MRLRLPFCLLSVLVLHGQDPALKETLATGKALWAQQGDREGAAQRLEQVLAALAPEAARLNEDWLRVLCEAHAWMAILEDRVPARRPNAQKHLEQMVELDPGFDIDRTVTNTRLQTAFDGLRSTRLARVTLSLAPDGGRFEVDGKGLAAASGLRYVRPGSHTFVYRKPGFKPATLTLDLQAREAKPVALVLERVASTVTVVCSPPEVTLTLDGRVLLQGRRGQGAAAAAAAEKLGVKPDQVSEELVVEGIGPGEHLLDVSAPCHRTRHLKLPADMGTPFADHALEPVKLERASARLSVSSRAPGGMAFLSGRPLGPLPLQDLDLCPGTYEFRVEYPAGGFTQNLEVADGAAVSLEARPKPRMAFLGLQGTEDFAGKERLLAQLPRFGERLKEVAFLGPAKGDEPLADALARLRLSKGAELVCYLMPGKERPVRLLEAVVATLTGEEARWSVNPLDQDPLAGLAARLNAQPSRTIRDAGLRLVDVPGLPGPLVLEVSEAAQAAGVRPLVPLTRAGAQGLTRAMDLRAALGGEASEVVVEQEGKTLTVPIVSRSVELPLQGEAYAYPLLLVDLALRRQGATGDEAGLLAFHQAQALMHFRRFDRALEILRDARLSATEGVSQGTLAYYEGLCLLRLGQVFLPDARQAFTRAAGFPKATLFGPDGPPVAPLARQMLDDIKP